MVETKKYFLILFVTVSLVIFFPSAGRAPGAQELILGARVSVPRDLPVAADRSDSEPQPKRAVPGLRINAAAVLLRDVDSGLVLYEKESASRFPIASLTKLMTALVVDRLLGPDEVVEIQAEDLRVPEYRVNLVVGERVYAQDLVKAMLIASGNDAAYALARHASGSVAAFAQEMNREARILGMRDTAFTNPAGLDHPGHYSTARDLSLLVDEFLLHPELVEIAGTSQSIIASLDGRQLHRLETTNRLLGQDQAVVGLKTGYTSEARGNLIALVDRPRFYTIILGSDQREAETMRLINWARENFIWK